jgi:hypothetical protein
VIRQPSAALLAVVALLAVPSGTVGATRLWTSPQTLSTAPAAGTPTLAFDASGAALATWATARVAGRRAASRTAAVATFRHDRGIPNIGQEVVEGLPPAPVVDSSGHVIVIQQRRIRPACGLGTMFTLTPRFGRVNSTFAPAVGGWTIFSRSEPPAVALAGNGRGLAVVAWTELRRGARHRCLNAEIVRVAVRAPGGRFGTAVTLSRAASAGSIAASVGQHGEVLVAWRYHDTIETRSRSARGHWGPTSRIRAGLVDSFAAMLASDGAAHVVWTRAQPTGPLESPRMVGAAVRGAHSTRFATSVLERGSWPVALLDRPERWAVRLARTPHGVLAAWTSSAGDHLQVLTATATRGRFGAARLATPVGQDFALGDLATSTTGRAALALASNASEAPSGPFVALGTVSGTFSAPEAVGRPGPRNDGTGAALAFSPRTGRPTLVWTRTGRPALASTRR